jgi:hypothetical protein
MISAFNRAAAGLGQEQTATESENLIPARDEVTLSFLILISSNVMLVVLIALQQVLI